MGPSLVDVAASMKQEIYLFVNKYRLDRSVIVFSNALEPQNLEFFTNYYRRKTFVDGKTVVTNEYFLSDKFTDPRLDPKRKYELPNTVPNKNKIHFIQTR